MEQTSNESYFCDTKVTLKNGTDVVEKGRVYKVVNSAGDFKFYEIVTSYKINGVERIICGLTGSAEFLGLCSTDISRAIMRKSKSNI